MRGKDPTVYRCRKRKCRKEFQLKKQKSMKKATMVKCPKCGSKDVEFVKH